LTPLAIGANIRGWSVAVHLLLGSRDDPCCSSVRTVLEARNYPTRIISNPLTHPTRFSWRLSNERSASQLLSDDEPAVRDDRIASVLVRSTGWADPAGWQPDDLAYVQAEIQAALLAWLWSLPCPVVNRYPPAIWYQPRAPLLAWQRLIRQSGLPAADVLVTNVEKEARAFGRRLARRGVTGAVYGPLTGDLHYLISDGEDWRGLAAMQRRAPVSLTEPHGTTQFACVVGEDIVWGGQPPPERARLEPALRRFAAAAGLDFVELAFAPTSGGLCVVAVEPQPQLEHFGDSGRQIVEGLVRLLTTEAARHPEGAAPSRERRA
jgi:hypothetical protein